MSEGLKRTAWAESNQMYGAFAPHADQEVLIEKVVPEESWETDTLTQCAAERFEEYTKWRETLFNASLLRVVGYERTEDSLLFKTTDDITYRDVVGLRQQPDTVSIAPFTSLTAIARVITSDGQVVFIHRDSGDWSEGYEMPGGFVRGNHTHPNLQSFIEKRTREDLGLKKEATTSVFLRGFWHANHILECMGIFDVHISLSAIEMQTLLPSCMCLEKSYTEAAVDEIAGVHYPSKQVLLFLRDRSE